MAYIEIIEGVGLTVAQLVLIGTFGFGLIIAAKDIRISIMVWVLLFMSEFILFYEMNSAAVADWQAALVAFLISIVLLILMMYNSYSKSMRNIV